MVKDTNILKKQNNIRYLTNRTRFFDIRYNELLLRIIKLENSERNRIIELEALTLKALVKDDRDLSKSG